jgi:hypothetical protein
MTWAWHEVHWVFWVILLVVAFNAARYGIKHSEELTKQKGASRHMRVRPIRKDSSEPVPTPAKPVRSRRTRPAIPVPLDSNDLDELDAMFGSAGDDPADY